MRAIIATHRERAFQWLARIDSRRHMNDRVVEPDGLNHAIIELKSSLEDSPDFGKVILIGCACGSTFWRNRKAVPGYQVEGDWAAPFRKSLGVRGEAPAGQLKRHKKFMGKP